MSTTGQSGASLSVYSQASISHFHLLYLCCALYEKALIFEFFIWELEVALQESATLVIEHMFWLPHDLPELFQ